MDDFIRTEGAATIGGLAHPLYTAVQYRVEHSGHTYYIQLTYKNGDGYFHCDYTLSLTSTGEIVSLSADDCNSPFSLLFECFDFSDAFREQVAKWANDENNYKFVQLVGKSLSRFTAKDVCMVRLYLQWHRDYYSRY